VRQATVWLLVLCYGVLAPLCCCARAAVVPVHTPGAERAHAVAPSSSAGDDCCSKSGNAPSPQMPVPTGGQPQPDHDCNRGEHHCDQCKAPQPLGTVGDSADLSQWLLPTFQPASDDPTLEFAAALRTFAAPPPECCPLPRSGRATLLTLCRLSI